MRQDDESRNVPDGPVEQPAVRTTIVGGRPPGSGRSVGAVPRGIEILLKKAAVDAGFRAELLARRSGAAELIGLRIEPAEAAMLDAAPAAQLQAIIAATRVDERVRSAFLGRAAGVMLAALTAVGAGCERDAPTKGVRPDDPAAADRATAPADPAAVISMEAIEPHRVTFQTPAPDRVVVVAVDGRPVDLRPDGPPNWGRPGELITVYVVGRPVFVHLPVKPAAYSAGIGVDLPPTSQPAGPTVDQVTRGARPDVPPTTQPEAAAGPTTQADAAWLPPTDGAIAPQELDRLIGQLDDRAFAVREAAQRRLEAGVPGVLPRLRQALAGGELPVEAAERVREIVRDAERIEALVGKLGEPILLYSVAGMVLEPPEPPADQAERELLALGPKALPMLRGLLAGGGLSPEAMARVQRIVAALDPKPGPPATQPDGPMEITLPPDQIRAGRVVVVAGALVELPPDAIVVPPPPDAPATVWTCSMHPQIQLRKPGQCPICNMDLIPEKVVVNAGPPVRLPPGAIGPPAAAVTTQPDAGAMSPDEFERLVTQLDAPKFADREAAHKRLVEAGRPFLPQMRQRLADKDLPPETAWRLGEVVRVLDPPPVITVDEEPQFRIVVGLGGRF